MELREVYETNLRLEERRGVPGVLGVVEGVFFLPEVPSRNGRVYPRALWERVLSSPDVVRLLENRLMLGTVGHEDIDFDALVREQKVSHVVTRLWIGEDGKGYGRAEILDTPVGRILYTLLKSGSRLAVSSKGWGEYKGTNSQGLFVVDEGSYILERFDFVVDPGFIEAVPGLKEQFENVVVGREKDKKNEGGRSMEIVEVLVKEKAVLQDKLNEALMKIKELEEEKEKLIKENRELKEKVGKASSVVSKKFDLICEKWLGVKGDDILKEIQLIGKIVEEEAERLVKKGVKRELLEGDTLSEVLLKVFLESRKVDGVFERKKLVESMIERRKRLMGMLFEAKRRNKRLEKLLLEARRKLALIESLGGLKKIVTALKMSERFVKRLIEKRMKEETERLSSEYGVSRDDVKNMLMRMGLKKTEESLKRMKRFSLREGVERIKDVSEREFGSVVKMSLVERLVEKFKDVGK